MSEQKPINVSQGQEKQLLGKVTTKGKIRARYTLKCEFVDGNRFTYRSDITLQKYISNGYKNLNELDALVLLFTDRRNLIQEAKLFDNSRPAGQDLLMHYSGTVGKVFKNELPEKYKLQ